MSVHVSNKSAKAFVFVVVLVDSIGFGLILPVLPQLIMQLTGVTVDRAAVYGGGLSFVYALMQFFCAPVLGNLSDQFGRRPVLLFALLALGCDYLIMGFAPTIALAVRRAPARRLRRRLLHARLCLHGGHHRAGEARAELRPAGRRLRHRLHRRVRRSAG